MRRFRYCGDPLCAVACALYVLNRFWLRSDVGGPFLAGYFNDLLLIPAALPGVLWLQRRLGVRPTDGWPQWREIILHFAAWAVVAEAVMPHLLARATGDWRDGFAYAAGAVVAGCWWQCDGLGLRYSDTWARTSAKTAG